MRPRSNEPARPLPTHRRDRFWGLAVAVAVFVAALFVVAPAMGVFTVPTADQPVASQDFTTPAAVGAPTDLGCTWTNTAADPTSVELAWTNAQAWSPTQIQRNVNGGAYANSGSAVAAGTSTVTNTAVTTPASNQYGWKAMHDLNNWESSLSSEVTDETCKGAINKLMTGAINARLNNVNDVAIDSLGNTYLADSNSHRIRCIAATSRCGATVGNIYTYAGDGTSGTTSTRVNSPKGVWIDQYDNLLIADSSNGAVRVKLVSGSPTTLYGQTGMSAGNMYTVAGNIGTTGFAGHDIDAVDSTVRMNPQDIATDSLDNLYIADGGNHRIRCVAETTKCGGTDGNIYTWAGDGTSGSTGDDGLPASGRVATPTGITVNSDDTVIWTDRTGSRLRMVYAGGEGYGVSSLDVGNLYTITSGLSAPWNVAVDDANNLLFGESTGYVNAFFADDSTARYGIPTPTDNTVYAIAGTGGSAYNGTGLPITGTGAATIGLPYGIAINPTDPTEVFAVDNGRNVLRKIDYTHGFTFTWAGISGTSSYVADDVPAHGWEYTTLNHSTIDSDGNVYFADSGGNRIRKWIPACECLVVAAGAGGSSSNGDGGSPLTANINAPQGVHIDSAGNMYIAETGAHKIRMVPASSMTRFTQAMTEDLIYTIMGNGNACGAGSAPCGDGSLVSAANRLNSPRDVMVDGSGNLIVSDGANCEIRFVPITTATFFGAARTTNYIYNLGGQQRTCGTTGDGGVATSGTINTSDGIDLDGYGNLLISEAGGYRIRLIASSNATMYGTAMTAGFIYTFAGSAGSCGDDDGDATADAEFCNPRDVSYDADTDTVYVADTGNDLIRKVVNETVSTLAGGGSTDPGDTGPGRGAVLTDPAGAVINPGGDLYITQTGATLDMRVIVGPDP